MTQLVKNLPAMQETWVRSLGKEDPLEKGKATHSSILAWRILYSPWDRRESNMTERLSLLLALICITLKQTSIYIFYFYFKGLEITI